MKRSNVQVHTASCLLVVVDSVEGPDKAHSLALALVEAALQTFLCDLCAELVRFLYPASDLDEVSALNPQGVPLKSSGLCEAQNKVPSIVPANPALLGRWAISPQSTLFALYHICLQLFVL
jgi:hypothetical protein